MIKRICKLVICGISFSVSWVSVAHSQDSPALEERDKRIIPALVKIQASGQDRNGVPKSETFTGFVSSRFGHIITAYHGLGAILEHSKEAKNTFKLKLQIGAEIIEQTQSGIVFPGVLGDIAVLNFPSPSANRKFLCFLPRRAEESLRVNDTRIYSSGFPLTESFLYGTGGIINSMNTGAFWLTDLKMYPGISGSPIYTSAGQVIGIAQGEYGTLPGTYAFIPPSIIRSNISGFINNCPKEFENVNESVNKPIDDDTKYRIAVATSYQPKATECIFLGKRSAIQSRAIRDAPFGIDLISVLDKYMPKRTTSLEPLQVKWELTRIYAKYDVNVRSTCPYVNSIGKEFNGSITSVLHMGKSVDVNFYLAIPKDDDIYFWGQLQNKN